MGLHKPVSLLFFFQLVNAMFGWDEKGEDGK